MDVNFFSAVAVAKAVLPGMIAQRCGAIVLVSSVQGYFGQGHRSSYAPCHARFAS